MTLTRRTFLESSASVLAGAAWSAFPGRRLFGRATRVLVIGAGPSGITAAHELAKAGLDVTVLEARTRAGGRMRTLREPFADELYAEAGALFLTTDNPGLEYARELGLSVVDVPFRQHLGKVAHVGGQRIEQRAGEPFEWPLEVRADEQGKTISELQRRYHYEASPPREEFQAMLADDYPSEVALGFDELSLADFWRDNGASEAAIGLMALRYFGSYGDSPRDVSLLQVLRERASYMGSRGFLRVEGGNDLIVRGLAAGLGAAVHYASPVVAVAQDDAGVRVTVRGRGGQEELSGDYLVCSVPLQVLGQIEVSPPLSELRARAVREVGSGDTSRVYVQCRERFWEEDGLDGTGNTDLPIGGSLHSTVGQPGTRGILEAYAVGPGARALAAADPEERRDQALEGLTELFPRLPEFAEGGTSHCWNTDPWARGAFSVFAPGQIGTFHTALRQPEGRIHFAGDALDGAPGYSHSAFQSGRRVAAEILARV